MIAAILGLFIMLTAAAYLRAMPFPLGAEDASQKFIDAIREQPRAYWYPSVVEPAYDPLAFWLFPDWAAAGNRPCWMVPTKP